MLARRSLQRIFTTTSTFQRFIHLKPKQDNLDAVVGDHASEERTFTEKEVFQFSDICGDKNLIHIDENYAAQTKFKSRIVHGILVASVFSKLCSVHFPGCIYMKQDLKFVAPVHLDEVVRIEFEVAHIYYYKILGEIRIKDIIKDKNRILLETTVTKVKENKPAILGEAMVYYDKLSKSS